MNTLKTDKSSVKKQDTKIICTIYGNYYYSKKYCFTYIKLRSLLKNAILDIIKFKNIHEFEYNSPECVTFSISIQNIHLNTGHYRTIVDVWDIMDLEFSYTLKEHYDEEIFNYLSFREDRDDIEKIEETGFFGKDYESYITDLFNKEDCLHIAEKIVNHYQNDN